MKTGMSTACFFGKLLNEQSLLQIGKMGIRDAELFFSAQMEYEQPFLQEVKRVLKGEGMHIRSVHALSTQFEPQLFSIHPRQYQEAIDVYRRVLDAAFELDAHIYVFHGPVHLKVARKPNINFEYVGERISLLAEEAAQRDVRFTYENVHWCWYQYPGYAKKLQQYVSSDNLYFTLDMKQAAQSGYSVFDYMDDMGDKLAHIHVCDYKNDAEKGIIPLAPFEGETDWEGLKNKLAEMSYDGMLMLEIYVNNYQNFEDLQQIYNRVQAFFSS